MPFQPEYLCQRPSVLVSGRLLYPRKCTADIDVRLDLSSGTSPSRRVCSCRWYGTNMIQNMAWGERRRMVRRPGVGINSTLHSEPDVDESLRKRAWVRGCQRGIGQEESEGLRAKSQTPTQHRFARILIRH